LIRQFLIALGFLTWLPAGRAPCNAKVSGARRAGSRSLARCSAQSALQWLGSRVSFFPPLVTAVFITAMDALITGAMHFDGVADTADGFGSGRTPDDVLRIMRDPTIGSYGACVLSLVIALKIVAISALVGRPAAIPAIFLAPVLGRWSAVFSSVLAGYARPVADDSAKSVGSPIRFIGRAELLVASAITMAVAVVLRQWRGTAVLFLVAVATALWTFICRRRIGGVTGDTLGAGVELSECLGLLVFTVNW
jgi:adenosylcobinamide-GDP ribazoletransferase